MNNTTRINIFNSDNSNIAYINTQHRKNMATIANRILKFESMIKKPIVANHTFFSVITFGKMNSFAYINSLVAQLISNLQKVVHQDNLSFACLQFYKHNCLNMLASNIFFCIHVKDQYK